MSTRCEEVVAALATGGPIRRWRARRHAARCPRCAAAREELRQVALTLADVPPLTARPASALDRGRRWRDHRGAVADVVVSAGPGRGVGRGGPWSPSGPGGRPVRWIADRARRPSRRSSPPAVRKETLRDVEGLRGGVVALSRELDDLRRRADLLDARKEVDALMARLGPRGGSSGL